MGTLRDELLLFLSDILIGMANNMTFLIDWNVQFQSQTEGEKAQSLYVHMFIDMFFQPNRAFIR